MNKRQVLVLYNTYYDNVPLGLYRYLKEGLDSANFKIFEFSDIGDVDISRFDENIIINLTPFANMIWDNHGKTVYSLLDDMHTPTGDFTGMKKIIEISTKVFVTQKMSRFVQKQWKRQLDKFVWLPHFCYPFEVNTEFKDKKGSVIFGHYNAKDYPFRMVFNNAFEPEVVTHPGYNPLKVNPSFINKGYYNKLSNYEFCVASGGNYGYIVSKYFEIPYTGCILIGEKNNGTEELGFIDGFNCLLFDKSELAMYGKDRVNNLRKANKLEDISKRGIELILSRHMLSHRIKQIIKQMEDDFNDKTNTE